LKVITNAEMTPAEVRKFCTTEDTAQSLLRAAMKQLYLSARAFHRILKISRTIADFGRQRAYPGAARCGGITIQAEEHGVIKL